ncbi:hypothetical protein [Calothrix sp. UHCC 0171]|uniref:hypothetical protein n=1 Tax=Calothrix sp. UHCC 0171 TaxID=3110245 RepID=UPI002B1F0F36|nr:hypothetical protein [Calothrix sp. UHCC 0171]MEA5570202.1 hypothetical protein [Calothrix sp. UHCC 0171]
MAPDEIESALQAAFNRCDVASCPLTDQQKQILLQMVEQNRGISHLDGYDDGYEQNPLHELSSEELQVFLGYVKTKEAQNIPWKIQLLNDWLHGEDSGEVHFIRQRYGVQWLDRLQHYHFDVIRLKVGDRIEVCNALWEWVQDNSPCQREWFPCDVIQVYETNDGEDSFANCIVRFQNGTEYEINGIYEWNQCNWRWLR